MRKVDKNKKYTLYDFSLNTAILVIFAYIFITFIVIAGLQGKTKIIPLYATLGIVAFISLLFLIWYYIILAVRIDEEKVKHGKKMIPIYKLKVKTNYNRRFKEHEIIFYQKGINYERINPKEIKKMVIKVENTKRNCDIINGILGDVIDEKAKTRKRNT